nr:tandem-95 repeat protein [Methylobacterium sp. OTU13CASTA1]
MFERFRGKVPAGSELRVVTAAMPMRAIRALEPRFVFDGAAAPAAAQAHADAATQSHGDPVERTGDTDHAAPPDTQSGPPAAAAPAHETASTNGRHEIVVIDRGVADLATLLAGVPAAAEVILIDSATDGFDQLADALKGRSGIDAIHILSHGSAGDLRLGTGDLTAATIQGRYAADLAIIGNALTAKGDLVIYGCDFAAGDVGARAAAMLASATGADVAASDDATGATTLGGDWNLEVHDGAIETGVALSETAQHAWAHLLAAAENGRGALLAVSDQTIYSVDIFTGKATALTTAPSSVGGITLSGTLNSLAVDQANGLIYYVDGAADSNNKALFAYDFVNDQHIIIKSDLTQGGAGTTIVTGSQGLGQAGAAFSSGTLYLAVENVSNTTDRIYKLTFSNNGRIVTTAGIFGSGLGHDYNWGDITVDPVNNQLVSLTSISFARFDLATGNELSFVSGNRTDFQTGFDQGGLVYSVGTNITQINPNTGAAIGSGKAITTDGSTALANITDAASWTPPTSTISGRVFADRNTNANSDNGEAGLRGVTVQLVDDSNGNRRVDSGERVLATETSAADGSYSFTGILPGQFVVRVTDAEGRLSTATATTATFGALTDSKVGATLAGPNFGYNPAVVLDLDESAAGTGYVTSYTERAAGVAIVDSDVTITDIASTTITSARAVITNGSGVDTLAINGTLPASINAVYDLATYTLRLTGSASLVDYQTALQQIRFSSADRDPSTTSRTVAIVVNDSTIDSNTTVSTIAFTALDDAPMNSVPGAQTVNEDTGLVFSTGNSNAILVADIDARGGSLTTMLSVAHGTLTLGSTTGVSVSGNGTGAVTLTGTASAINTALDGTIYRPVTDFNGTETLTVGTSDNGNTGTGGPLTDSDSIAIIVAPVNDAPVLDLDASAAGTGFQTTYMVGSTDIAIVDTDVLVTDVDGATIASAKVVIANHQTGDTLAFAGTPPQGIIASYDPATSTLTLTGSASKADYQTALQQIRYAATGPTPATTTRTIAVTVNDGALDSNVTTTTVTFDGVNAAPVNALPADQTMAEEGSLVFSTANGNRITVSDPDAGTGNLTTTIRVAHGTLTPGATTGVTVTGSGTGAITFTGTAAAINMALDGTTYWPVMDFNGAETLTIVTDDNGNTGSGGAQSDTDTLSITVTPVNDAPVNGVPAAQSVDQDTDLVFSSSNGNAITVSDVDADAGGVTTTLSVQHGTLRLSGTANVTVTGSGTGNVTLSGTVSDITAALNGAIYRGDAAYQGSDTLTITTNDGGNTGTGGSKSDTGIVGLTVRPVAHAPANAVPAATQTVNEDTPLVFQAGSGNGVSVADADGGMLTVTLSSAQGLLTLSRTTGLTFVQGDGTGDGAMRFSGLIADINAALEGLRFDPAADRNGAAQIALTTVDPQGATASSTIAVSLTPVADIVPDMVGTAEDTPITFNALTGTNGASADTFNSGTREVSAVTQGGHGAVGFQPDGALTYTPAAEFNGTDSFSYTVTSGGTTETATVTVTVRPVNDAPILDLSATVPGTGYATRYTERAAGIAIVATDTSVSDVDNATLASATAFITNGQTGDTLSITGALPTGIAARFDPATFTLTLTGAATKADYQTALGLVQFFSAERDPSTMTRTINVRVDDGALASNAATTTIAFTAVNDAPVNGLPVNQTAAEDTPLVFSAATRNGITVSDADARTGTLTTTLGVLHGTLTLGSNAGVTVTGDGSSSVTLAGTVAAINAALDGTRYRPAADYNGPDTLTILTNDGGNTGTGGAQTDTDTLALTVTSVNDAPRAGVLPAVGSLDGDSVTGTDLGRAFSDAEGDALRFAAVGLPAGLTINPATGIISGSIDRSASRGGINGDYAVVVTANDGIGGSTSRTFTWRVVDPAPVARNDGALTDARTPTFGSVLADNGNGADSDPDGDPLRVTAVNGSASSVGQIVAGTNGGRFAVLVDGRYGFEPGADFADLAAGQTRTTRISYTISDGDGGTAMATLTMTVTGRSDVPATFVPGDQAAGDGETMVLPQASQFPGTDGAAMRYSASGLPPGLAIDSSTGTVRGTIDHAASGATGLADYRVTITATDLGGAETSRSFTFRVTNPAPQAFNDAATTAEDRPVTVDVLANDMDRDGDRITIVATGDAAPRAGHGRVTVANGTLFYTPDTDFNGADTITYALVDENGGTSTASVTVTVTPVNDAPNAGTLPDQAGRVGAPVSYDIATRFRDPDTDPAVVQAPSGDRLGFSASGLPPGLAIDPATGLITGTLPRDVAAVTAYAVTVTATDFAGASVTRGFTWTVADGAPIAAPDTATTRAGSPVLVAVTANDVAADGDAIRLVDAPGATTAAHGTVSVDPATGLLTYTPDSGFSGKDTVVYTIEDAKGLRATGILTVIVTPVNQRPVAPEPLPARTGADGERVRVPLGPLITDPEGAALAYTVTGLPPGLTIDRATGTISGTFDYDASGPSGRTTYVVTLTATDPGGLAVSRSFAWTVTNPAPSATDDVITTDEDTPVDIDVTGNDRDPDGDPLSVVPGSATASHGTVTLNPDGSLRYTPNRDFNGADTILYTITDGNGGFATAHVAIAVSPVNDAPVFAAASPSLADRSASDGGRVSIPAGSAFSDVDRGDVLSFTATGLPPGLVIDPTTGLIAGMIVSDASSRMPGGVYTVTLTGTDRAGASATTRFAITVGNPAPVALDDIATLNEDGVLVGRVLGNDHDPDGDALRVDPVPVAGPLHGRVDLRPDGSFTYTPEANFHGEDAFTYVVIDSDGGRSTATVHLKVASVNDTPTATADPVATREDTPVDGRIVAGDLDGDPLTYTVETPPASGRVALRPDGRFTYTPDTAFNGRDGFTIRVSDGQGGSVLVAVPVAIAAVNDAPNAHADALATRAGVVGTGRVVATDRDGDPLSFRLASPPTNGEVVLAEDGSYAYMPRTAFSGSDLFTVEVSDGNGGITLVSVDIIVTAEPTLVPPPGANFPIPSSRLFFDAPAAPPVPVSAAGIVANGFILPAIAEIDSLGSLGDVIFADGAVLAAVNGIDNLHGTAIQIDHPVILQETDRIARLAWERFERVADGEGPWFSPRPYLGRSLGFSLSMDDVGAASHELMVEAIRRPDTLLITLRNTAPDAVAVVDVRLVGRDGSPAPDWIEGDGRGSFWGRPPAGTGLVALELEVVLEDGRVVRRPMTVNAETGEIRATAPPRSGADFKPVQTPEVDVAPRGEAPMFTAQLASLGRGGAPDFTLIEEALARAF